MQGSSWESRASSFPPQPSDWQACKSQTVKLESDSSPLQSRCLSAEAFVVWVEGVVVFLPLHIGCNCVGGKSRRWSSGPIEDGSVVVAVGDCGSVVVVVVGRIVVVVRAVCGWSSNKGCHGDIEGVSGGVARELVRPRILNLIFHLGLRNV